MVEGAPVELSARQLNRATLARQGLLAREPSDVVAAVERVAGLQAQEAKPPFVGLWTRAEGLAADHVRDAIRDGRLVRGALMRGTLHLASARDFAAWRPALQPALDASMRGVLKQRGSADLDVEAVLSAARELLAAGPLTFDDIRSGLQKRFPHADERSLGYAARMGLPLVMEPTDDPWGFPRAARFGLGAKVARTARPERLVRSYLAAFGPASAADFQTWSGLDGRAAFERLRGELATFTDDRGRELFDLPDAPRPDPRAPAPPRLVPDFDNLVLAWSDRRRIVADEHRPRIAPTKNLRIKATFLVDGLVAGTWKLRGSKLELEPFDRLREADAEALREEGAALAGFLKG